MGTLNVSAERLAPVVDERDAAIAERDRLRGALAALLVDAEWAVPKSCISLGKARAALNPEAKS
ncbi:MAG: hypothetical protein PHZ23_15985 [Acidiphilium sp.]|nr:hypothetical protein [Acidiphilium sp.]